MLAGDLPRLKQMRRIWGALPAPPRCKLCNAPFRGPGGILMRALAYTPSPLNRRLCRWCVRAVHKHPGGAEVEISVLFADVRGSTGIAERMAPEEFSRLMSRFYGAAAELVDDADGILDKFVGDSAVALFIPGFVGPDHAAHAVAAARELIERTNGWVPLGVAVHRAGRSWAPSGRATPETSRRSGTPSTRPRGSRALPGRASSWSARRPQRRAASRRPGSNDERSSYAGGSRAWKRGSPVARPMSCPGLRRPSWTQRQRLWEEHREEDHRRPVHRL
jgi:hypothetical protein